MRPTLKTLAMITLLLLVGPALAGEGYLRSPDLHGDRVVFVAEGDLWVCSDAGGSARRLTTHAGVENYPHFSPDGKSVAFTGFYDGNRDVYIMPAEGGEPRRLTWHPASDEVVGFTPDGKSVIFRSWRESPHFSWRLFTVPAKGGGVERIPLGWAARLDVEPGSGRYAFSRLSRETATWKRYRGGTAANIWVGDPKTEDYRQITEFDGTDAYPMWHGGRIYFQSDQGGTYNIWSMNPDGSDRRRHTDEGDWDARWPGMGPDGRIVYMLAGGLKIFDPATGKSKALKIELPSEQALTRVRYSDPGRFLEWFEISPKGDRVVVATRGEVFSVPAEKGVTLPISKGSGAREEYPVYDHEGKRILFLTDESGEEAWHTIDAWGRGDSKAVRGAFKSGYHHAPTVSPDGKYFAYSDEEQNLWLQPMDGGAPKKIDHCDQDIFTGYTWSPDGRWLAYPKRMANDYGAIHIYDTQDDVTRQVTSTYTDDADPAWDPGGKYLFYRSQRNVNPLFDTRDFNTVDTLNSLLYMVLLQADGENPFAHLEGLPPGDEDEDTDKDKGKEKDKKKDEDKDKGKEKKGDKDEADDDGDDAEKKELEPVVIDFAGIESRVIELAVEAGIYSGLGAVDGKLFYLSRPLQGWTDGMDDEEPPASLMVFDIEGEEAEEYMGGVSAYSLAMGGEKMAVSKGHGELYVVETSGAPSELSEAALDLGGIVLELDPREEWEQIYNDAWRRMRDRYWDPGMSGNDWKKLHDQYATLLPLLADRGDLSDLLGELIGELATSHTYVWGGDSGVDVNTVATGLLGADLSRDGDAFRVDRIYRGGDPDNAISPLLVPGVGVQEGDFILAVNGLPFRSDRPFFASFAQLQDKDVLLTVAKDAKGSKERRDVVVRPIGLDNGLRYADWVRGNREAVAERTDGKMAYIHIPDMGYPGMVAFNKWFYPQRHMEGMVVDCRWNGGGFISQLLLERFRRPVTAWDYNRWGRKDTYPQVQLNGPFVVLTNEFAGSDGDIFPRAVQLEKLAPVIGMRSWGGVIGINMNRRLVDGGVVTYPFSSWWDREMGWELENHGVDPDIIVQNPPSEVAAGKDRQLDRGIDELLRLHRENPPVRPNFGDIPSKSRSSFKNEK